MAQPIDAVVTWVDGNDSAHARKRRQYAGDAVIPGTLANAAEASRFNEAGELWYAIHLARLNAPWLRTIHLVTDDQRPAWLSDAFAWSLGIRVVDHEVIFRGYEEYLPTFNSQSIETMLHRIPGLAEQFIYLNDDMFILRPVGPAAFFRGGLPVLRGRWTWRNRLLACAERQVRRLSGREQSLAGLVGLRPERRLLRHPRYFRSAHAPHCLRRDDFARYFGDETFLRQTIQYRFRNRKQIWPIGYYANRALRAGRGTVQESDWAYLSLGFSELDLPRVLETIRADTGIKHLCIQSLDQLPKHARRVCFNFLDSIILRETSKPQGGVCVDAV